VAFSVFSRPQGDDSPGTDSIMATASRPRKPRRSPESKKSKVEPEPVRLLSISEIHPTPENDLIYTPLADDDPATVSLRDSIQTHGILEPLVISEDGFILSGHRRFRSARLAGLSEVPVRIEHISRTADLDAFMVRLREHNRQRDKSRDEMLREELLTVDPDEAYQSLIDHRKQVAQIDSSSIELREYRGRKAISPAKKGMLMAALNAINDLKEFWPISLRVIHYKLLNNPPLRHSAKPDSRYQNDKRSYQSLSDICTRGRLAGLIPMEAVSDDTRPVTVWATHGNPREFIAKELNEFGKGYYRNLLISQPHHFEMLVEKNTVEPFARTVASQYCIPLTSGRGYGSIPPRYQMAQRFRKSGKGKLVVIIASDFDPAGEEIAHSFARSMRDDFHVKDVHAVKAALTYEQVQSMSLQTDFEAKTGDSNYRRFVAKYGTGVFELEAVSPNTLQEMLRTTIDSILDVDAFNAEIDAEKADAAVLELTRRRVHHALREEI